MTKQEKTSNSRLKRILFLALGSASVLLGSIGILVPILPTTPFLLLAAFFYLRSSRRLYEWLINHRLLGKYIYHYLVHKAVPLQTKMGAVVILWASLIASMVLVDPLFVRIILAVIGSAVTVHILSLKTLHTKQTGAEITASRQTDAEKHVAENPPEGPLL